MLVDQRKHKILKIDKVLNDSASNTHFSHGIRQTKESNDKDMSLKTPKSPKL